jgi:hypothetical protein
MPIWKQKSIDNQAIYVLSLSFWYEWHCVLLTSAFSARIFAPLREKSGFSQRPQRKTRKEKQGSSTMMLNTQDP